MAAEVPEGQEQNGKGLGWFVAVAGLVGVSALGPMIEPKDEAPCVPDGTSVLDMDRMMCVPNYVEDIVDFVTPESGEAPEGEPAPTTTTTAQNRVIGTLVVTVASENL